MCVPVTRENGRERERESLHMMQAGRLFVELEEGEAQENLLLSRTMEMIAQRDLTQYQ